MSDQLVHKVTLSSNKIVLLRELKISHRNLAAKAAGLKAGDNTTVLALTMADELLKILLFKINDKPITAMMLEDLDALFSYQEYSELTRVLQQLMGDSEHNPKLEIVSIGAQ